MRNPSAVGRRPPFPPPSRPPRSRRPGRCPRTSGATDVLQDLVAHRLEAPPRRRRYASLLLEGDDDDDRSLASLSASPFFRSFSSSSVPALIRSSFSCSSRSTSPPSKTPHARHPFPPVSVSDGIGRRCRFVRRFPSDGCGRPALAGDRLPVHVVLPSVASAACCSSRTLRSACSPTATQRGCRPRSPRRGSRCRGRRSRGVEDRQAGPRPPMPPSKEVGPSKAQPSSMAEVGPSSRP